MFRITGMILGLCVFVSSPYCSKSRCETGVVTVIPREIDDLLPNPHMGIQTTGKPKSEVPGLDGIPSRGIYRRFYWNQIEPTEGDIRFDRIDDLISKGKREGQFFSFRVMCIGDRGSKRNFSPVWLREKGCNGWWNDGNWVPNMDDPVFKKYHYRLIRELGKRYDGDPWVEWVDIGTVGYWGEWHALRNDFPLPSVDTRREIIDLYFEAFPSKYKIMLIGADEGMLEYAVSRGAGVRSDGMGEVWHENIGFPGFFAKVPEAWKHAPIAGEAHGIINDWDDPNWRGGGRNNGLKRTIDNALARHYSFFNWQEGRITSPFMRGEIERFARRMGYRLVLRELKYNAAVSPGSGLDIGTKWENIGSAPPYFGYLLAFRLSDGTGKPLDFVTKTSIKGWLPGNIYRDVRIKLPQDIAPGKYELSLGVVDPATGKPAVWLAIDGRDAEGWYGMGSVRVLRVR